MQIKSIADRSRAIRSARGWSQRDLAERVGTTQATINRWEHGQLDAHFATINTLAEALEVSCCELVGCEELQP